jgi:hypothetical protein
MSGINLSGDQTFELWDATRSAYPWKDKLAELLKYQSYPFMSQWAGPDRVTFDGGTQITFDVMLGDNGSAKMVKPYQTTAVSVTETLAQMSAPWRSAQAEYSISTDEIRRNAGNDVKLVDLRKLRRQGAMMSMANMLEEKAWAAPTSSTDDTNPYGVPYWIVPITGTQATSDPTGAFQGSNASGFSTCGGIDASVAANARWRNWNATWSNSSGEITTADVLRMGRMLRHLNFKAPMMASAYEPGGGIDNLRLYACETIIQNLEKLARSQNDQLGSDVLKYQNMTLVKGIPVEWVPVLDADTTLPMYAINHDHWKVFVMEGEYFNETTPPVDRELHRVITTFVDLDYNFMVTNRQRAGGLISYVAGT